MYLGLPVKMAHWEDLQSKSTGSSGSKSTQVGIRNICSPGCRERKSQALLPLWLPSLFLRTAVPLGRGLPGKGHKGAFRSIGNACYLDLGGLVGYTRKHICKISSFYTFKIHALYLVSQ